MRSLVFASKALILLLAVLYTIGASHKSEATPATGSMLPAQTQPSQNDDVRRISVEELRAALEKGAAVVVDVRTPEQYRAGHIKGAILIPGDEIAKRTGELPKDRLIVTYCS
jgi:3-mercaptopyruvate sulfurtransferase SseA